MTTHHHHHTTTGVELVETRKGFIMLRSLITTLIAAPALVLGASPALAGPAVHDVYVEEFDGYEHFAAGDNGCVPWAGLFHEVRSGEAKLLMPSGSRHPGEVHINFVVDGFVEFIPDDQRLPTYSGTYREKADGIVLSFSGEGELERVMQWRLRTTLRGTDGSTLTLRMSGKVTTNGQGDIVVARDSFSCE
jgi:hypothetical protein